MAYDPRVLQGEPRSDVSVLNFTGFHTIKEPLRPSPGQRITGPATIQQLTWGLPVFDVSDSPGVTIENLNLVSTEPRVRIAGSFRGGSAELYSAGVWTNSHDTTVRDVKVSGFVCGVHFSLWGGESLRNRAERVQVDTVDFGILAAAQEKLRIRDVSGSYVWLDENESAAPHLVYISGDAGACRDVVIDDVLAGDSHASFPVQIKNTHGGRVSRVYCSNTYGILSVFDSSDLACSELQSVGDVVDMGSIYHAGSGNTRIHTSNVRIQSVRLNARAVRLYGENCSLRDVEAVFEAGTTQGMYLAAGTGVVHSVELKGATGFLQDGDQLLEAVRFGP